MRTLRIIEVARDVAIVPLNDPEDVEVLLMGALRVVLRDLFDFRKHALAEALEHERIQAPQSFPVGFRDRAYHRRNLFTFEPEDPLPEASGIFGAVNWMIQAPMLLRRTFCPDVSRSERNLVGFAGNAGA
jgi:hypothetical protein